ncbi:MAG TPA: nuclear transport factor 2 family protein [Solirubrobacteraceae bacterium]|jgi:ketosteroid isomerase-like protein|nr:nuclear transport factor 2 family protein [Solirubrobacteraceae bacterium]
MNPTFKGNARTPARRKRSASSGWSKRLLGSSLPILPAGRLRVPAFGPHGPAGADVRLRSWLRVDTDDGILRLMSFDEQERSVLLAERALQAAMRAGDVEELDRLLHPALLAVGPDGGMIDKAGDLAAHRAGIFSISELTEDEVRVTVLEHVAVTFVVLQIRGTIEDLEVRGRMRYTRTWTRDGGAWRVVAAHISPVAA